MPMNETTKGGFFQFKLQIGILMRGSPGGGITWSSTQVPRRIAIRSHPCADRMLGFERVGQTSGVLLIQTWQTRTQLLIELGFSSLWIQSTQGWSNPDKSWRFCASLPPHIFLIRKLTPFDCSLLKLKMSYEIEIYHLLAISPDANFRLVNTSLR